MVMVYLHGEIIKNIKETGKMVWSTDMENNYINQEIFMLANLLSVNRMAKVFFYGIIEVFTEDNFKMEYNMVLEFGKAQ